MEGNNWVACAKFCYVLNFARQVWYIFINVLLILYVKDIFYFLQCVYNDDIM